MKIAPSAPPGERMQVRPMRVEDIARAIEIAAGLAQAPHWPAAAYESALDANRKPRRIALVAVVPRAGMIGFLVSRLVEREAELESIAVCGSEQRKGAGRLLLDSLLPALAGLGILRLDLELRASNRPAEAFYLRYGFRGVGSRPDYYADPVEDAVLMSLDVRAGRRG